MKAGVRGEVEIKSSHIGGVNNFYQSNFLSWKDTILKKIKLVARFISNFTVIYTYISYVSMTFHFPDRQMLECL